MIDSHCHLDLPVFDGKHDAILTNCAKMGISRIMLPGLSLAQFSRLTALQKQFANNRPSASDASKGNPTDAVQAKYPVLDIALGLHPYFLSPLNESQAKIQANDLYTLAHKHRGQILAIGECGIDGSLKLDMAYQIDVLRMQIELANSLDLPLILHHRQSHNELIRLLKEVGGKYSGVIHAFSGSEQIANTYIELGFALGVGGTITYERAVKTRSTLAAIPLEHLLLETDAPDMPLFGYQGQTNTPERLPIVAKTLANLKGVDTDTVITTSSTHYQRVFLT